MVCVLLKVMVTTTHLVDTRDLMVIRLFFLYGYMCSIIY